MCRSVLILGGHRYSFMQIKERGWSDKFPVPYSKVVRITGWTFRTHCGVASLGRYRNQSCSGNGSLMRLATRFWVSLANFSVWSSATFPLSSAKTNKIAAKIKSPQKSCEQEWRKQLLSMYLSWAPVLQSSWNGATACLCLSLAGWLQANNGAERWRRGRKVLSVDGCRGWPASSPVSGSSRIWRFPRRIHIAFLNRFGAPDYGHANSGGKPKHKPPTNHEKTGDEKTSRRLTEKRFAIFRGNCPDAHIRINADSHREGPSATVRHW